MLISRPRVATPWHLPHPGTFSPRWITPVLKCVAPPRQRRPTSPTSSTNNSKEGRGASWSSSDIVKGLCDVMATASLVASAICSVLLAGVFFKLSEPLHRYLTTSTLLCNKMIPVVDAAGPVIDSIGAVAEAALPVFKFPLFKHLVAQVSGCSLGFSLWGLTGVSVASPVSYVVVTVLHRFFSP